MMLAYHDQWDKILGRHKDLERSCTSWKSVSPVRNRILVYPDFNEEDEEYYSLPQLLSCLQTPQSCATFNFVHRNSHSEVDIENMTLEEYARYELAMSTIKNKEDSNLDKILDDLFRIGAENIRKLEHEVPNRRDDITDYEDNNEEDGELPDLPTFSATNEFASACEQVKENIDVNTAWELEEVQVENFEMDDDYDIDHSNTEKTLQWSLAKYPFLVCMKYNDQPSFLLHTIPSSISNEVKREFTIPHSLNTAYGLLLDMTYWILFPFVVFGECKHKYAVSSLMDTAYWMSEQ
ncbi:hypothetical protein Tco_1203027 [Tanacetum coccineum]